MKRIVVFLISIFCLCSPIFLKGSTSGLVTTGANKVCIISSEEILLDESEVVQNGNQFYYFFSCDKFESYKSKFKKIDGLNFYFDKDSTQETLIKQFSISQFSTSSSTGMKILTGYTSVYSDFRFVDGKKVNVQIAWAATEVVVGFPLILTGY